MTPQITMPKFYVSCSKQTDCLMILFVIVLFVSTGLSETTYDVKNPPTWKVLADRRLSRLKRSVQIPHPKNVIIFIGDGMSVGTVTATRYTRAYDQGKPAGDVLMEWEEWTDAGLMRTFCADKMTTDSAAAATALFGGEKGHIFTIGVTGPVDCCKCTKIPRKNQVKSIFLYAQDRGLSTGLVTTTRVTHATPAGAYAVTQNRDWEMSVPSKLPGTVRCEDIASQLVHHGVNFNVILGGGHSQFYGSPEPETPPVRGKRTDGQNLIRNWISKQAARSRRYAVVFNRTELRLVDTSKTDYLLGLLARSHMQYDLLRNDQPSLEEMTKTAIEILSRNPKGYLLMVEGGRIDHGHHSNKAKIAITETLALEMAVKRSLNLTNPEETLIIVTADHSHAFSLQGYAHRDKSVLDIDDTQNVSVNYTF
ncbi:unnamed protein product [Calicophoron daubneyi]|uniref:alkaline phosphatase n=1 Tax=Calicophoron daubneyi TaxID=300641 RepID=A0AAV2TNZ3_CALDB